jgi:hypothetical protein
MPTLDRPVAGGPIASYTTRPPRKICRSAAAVEPHRPRGRARGADPLPEQDPCLDCAIDWDRTMAGTCGRSVSASPSSDTVGLDWATSLDLIGRSIDAARDHLGARRG